MKIAFLGLGVMGFPMAGYLAKSGFEVTVYNRTLIKSENWIKSFQGTYKKDPRDAVSKADIVCMCLGGDDDIKEVLLGSLIQAIKPGSLLIDHTTASVEIAKKIGEISKEKNIQFLDAPISGGQRGAEEGTLSIMVGGESQVFERAQPILKCYGKNIVLVGPTGAGQTTKIINQICIAGLLQGLAEGIAFGKKSGIDLEKVFSVINQGAAQSWQMNNRADTMIHNQYDFGFAVKWMIKDLKIALAEGKKINANLELTEQVLAKYQKILNSGGGHLDTSSLLTLID